MADPKTSPRCCGGGCGCGFLLLLLCPVALALVLAGRHGLDFDPARLPGNSDLRRSASAEEEHGTVLEEWERVGEGLLPGPEDFAYDDGEGFMYTGCSDGWIKRVRVAKGVAATVEDWAHVGGRPLGVALAPDGSLVVAEPYKGLLRVRKDAGEVSVLTYEAEGRRFKLTDGVDVASNGIIYFTDASFKYNLEMHMLDIFEGRPFGRLLSFDPSSNQTSVLAKDLYFSNGVSLSPDQLSLIFCETPLRRCRRYHIKGEKKGLFEDFVENLPGFPDNIRYDGDGYYWIALATEKYGRLVIEKHGVSGTSDQPNFNQNLWVDTLGGFTKGRLYGFGGHDYGIESTPSSVHRQQFPSQHRHQLPSHSGRCYTRDEMKDIMKELLQEIDRSKQGEGECRDGEEEEEEEEEEEGEEEDE